MLNYLSPKLILVQSNKGGVGKTTISYALGKFLAANGKKVLIYDFDSINSGLTRIHKLFGGRKFSSKINVLTLCSEGFFHSPVKSLKGIYGEYDYIVIDGFISEEQLNVMKKICSYVLCAVFIVSDDTTVDPIGLKDWVEAYMKLLKNRLGIIFNEKNGKKDNMKEMKLIVAKLVEKLCKNNNFTKMDFPYICKSTIPHFKDSDKIFTDFYTDLGDLLLPIVQR